MARDLIRKEVVAVAFLLASPSRAFTPDMLTALPRDVLRTRFAALPHVAETSSLRIALAPLCSRTTKGQNRE